MARVGKSLRTYLLTKTAITNLVGQRIYPDELKQNATLPAMVYRVASTQREHTIGDLTKFASARVEFYVFAETRDGSEAVADAVRTSGVCAYRGTTDSIFFHGIEWETGEQYVDDIATDGNQNGNRAITSFDLMVHYSEAS